MTLAPVASVVLTAAALLAGALGTTGTNSVGLPLRVARIEPCYPGDTWIRVIQISAGGSLKINNEPIGRAELGQRLDDIFRTRWLRGVYVIAEPGVSFGEVAGVLDIASQHVDHVALVPNSRVPERIAHAGEGDTCMDMRIDPHQLEMSDRTLSTWH